MQAELEQQKIAGKAKKTGDKEEKKESEHNEEKKYFPHPDEEEEFTIQI
jgi:hypothetical protein